MIEWWNTLTIVQKLFAYVAIPSTLLLIIQTVLLAIGMGQGDSDADDPDIVDGDIDLDGDTEGAIDSDPGLRIFTVRGFVAFFCTFGWMGILLTKNNIGELPAFLISLVFGLLCMFGLAYMLKAVLKLQSSGNISISNALGKSGTVYLSIPPKREGRGKINIYLQDRYCELEAVTDYEDKIPVGAEVTVVSLSGDGVLVVVPKVGANNKKTK